jgi:hypothetical protein
LAIGKAGWMPGIIGKQPTTNNQQPTTNNTQQPSKNFTFHARVDYNKDQLDT